MKHLVYTILLTVLLLPSLKAQESRSAIQDYLEIQKEELQLTNADINSWMISSEYLTKHNGIQHVHVQQHINGIEIFNGITLFTIKNGNVTYSDHRFINNAAAKVNTAAFSIDEGRARQLMITELGLEWDATHNWQNKAVYYLLDNGSLRLAHHVVFHTKDQQHVWNAMIDGVNGEMLSSWDQVLHCNFGEGHTVDHQQHVHREGENTLQRSVAFRENQRGTDAVYNVFELPAESPNHGPRALLTSPESLSGSPFGWHDNNGQPGADFTITRGNNVFAYEDADGNGAPGYSPEGGAALNFDFPFWADTTPIANQDAALTNLFYMNNMMHDVLHAYGFDEPSGNFQANNYGNGGSGGDAVLAQGFDGGGLNNATFFTPLDGQNPSMQMFLWNSTGGQEYLTVNSPPSVTGPYFTTASTFGPGIPTSPLTADLALYQDNTPPTTDACEDPINGGELSGKIVVIDRMECTFVDKIIRAQNAGAVAVIMVNNVATPPITMGGASAQINIPSVMISMDDGAEIKAVLNNNETINATIVDQTGGQNFLDGNFDNAVIGHEYGHGISNRLIGGRFNTNCMNNNEQMGEGWSDWYGMMLTLDMNAPNPVYRAIGSYVIRQDPYTGFGIRPAPYDTSFAVNDFTYGNIGDNNISIPHGVGFIWASMLWDLTWAFIDEYGYDEDLINGTGGNNIIMQLVTDGLKLTSCSPGFVSGRNGILQADINNNDGANQCMIWEVFARRGLGFSANQLNSNNVFDGNEAFDMPPSCLTELVAEIAVNQNISCDGEVQFNDASTGTPTAWHWEFGDGNTSDEPNPLHQYEEPGIYNVSLSVTNATDTSEQVLDEFITVVLLDPPTEVFDVEGCAGDVFEVTANSENTIQWYDAVLTPIGTGSPFTTPAIGSSTSIWVSATFTEQGVTCESDLVELTADISDADFTSSLDGLTVTFTDQSVNATSYLWDFGDGSTSTDQDPVHPYAGPGNYSVTLTINGICTFMASVEIVATSVAELFTDAGLTLIPNPAANRTMITSSLPIPKDALIQLMAVDGRKVLEFQTTAFVNEVEINLKNVANGMYQVVISLDDEILVRESLVISRK